MKKISKFVALGLVSLLAACGGGGGGTKDAAPLSYVAGTSIDGYLANAKVCVDLNLNFKCDTDEPFAITNANGEYAIAWSGGDASGLVVITETSKDTKDSDDNGLTFADAGRSAFVLAAPIPVGATTDIKITPFTTVVTINALPESASATKLSSGDIANSEDSLKKSLGISADKDLMKMDVSKDTNAKPIAQFMSHTLGEIQKSVTDNNAAKMKTAVVAVANATTNILQEGVLPVEVTDALKKPAAERAAELNKVPAISSVVSSTSKIVNLGTSKVDPKKLLKDGFVIAEITSGYNAFDDSKEANVGKWTSGNFLRVNYINYDADTKAYSEINRVLDNGWVRRADWGVNNFLTTNGTWIESNDNPLTNGEISFQENCVMTKENTSLVRSTKICFDEKNLSGIKIIDVNPAYCDDRNGYSPDQLECKAAKFKDGSKGYEITFSVTGGHAYSIDVPRTSMNQAYHYGNRWGDSQNDTNIASFVQTLVANKSNAYKTIGVWDQFSIRLKSYDASTQKGVFYWYFDHDNNSNTPVQDAGESDFEVKKVNGVDVLIFKPSLRYHQAQPGDMVGSDFMFAAKDNRIWLGTVEYADVKQQLSLNGFNWFGNRQMLESILSGLKYNSQSLPAFPFP